MTAGLGQTRQTSGEAHASVQSQRHVPDGSDRKPSFGDAEELYLHRGFCRRYFTDGGAAAAERERKWSAAGSHVFQAIENGFGGDVAASLFDRVGAGNVGRHSRTRGPRDEMENFLETVPAPVGAQNTSAQLDGTDRRVNFSTDVLEAAQNIASRHLRQVVAATDHPEGLNAGGTPMAGVSRSMAGDFGRVNIVVNGTQVSSSSKEMGAQEEHAAMAGQRLLDNGIRNEDLRVVGAFLHQGMIAEMLKAALEHPAAPVPFSFGQAHEKNRAEIGYGIDSTDDDGVYRFSATMKARFTTVQEIVVVNSHPEMQRRIVFDQTRPDASSYTFELHGTIDCNDAAASFDSANLSYRGELKRGR